MTVDFTTPDVDIIKKSEANLNTILDHADSGYALYNAELRIVAFNSLAQKFAHILYAKKLLEGNHLLSYFPEEKHHTLLDVTKRVLNGEDIGYEVCFIIDGSELWIKVKWLNVKNEENKNWGFILVSQDITESKLAAIKLEKITNELVIRNKALEQFANIISHNLRAPIANIINLIQMVDLMKDDDGGKQFMEFILSSSEALNKVIDDIHQILEVKQRFYETKEKIFFDELLEDIKTSVSFMIIKENVTLTGDFQNANYIYSIHSFLYSIFYNLILNSIKYRRIDVDPKIEVSSDIINNNLRLTFKDNGKGIDMKKNGANLFGLYKRFDNTVEGRGLGLFMIKTQIEELGGTINIQSEVGEGSTFIIEMPV